MGTGIEIAIAAAIAANSAAQQNQASRKQARAQRKQSAVQQTQIRAASNLERQKIQRQAALIRGAQEVSQAETGANLGSSLLQTSLDETLNLGILRENTANQLAAARANLGVNIEALSAQRQNVGLAAVSGGLQGASLGLTKLGKTPTKTTGGTGGE